MKLLLDTNILFDVYLNRVPFYTSSFAVLHAHENGRIRGFISAVSISNLFYVLAKIDSKAEARRKVRVTLDSFDILAVDETILDAAWKMLGEDYEDNIQIAGALQAKLDGIVTRDKDGFTGSPVRVFTPEALLKVV